MEKSSFEDALFDRARLADNLINLLPRLKDGQVISIDAPWGDGKTFFAVKRHAILTQ